MTTYLFDFDGTLVDSMSAYANAVLRLLDENNVSYPGDIIKTITPLGLNGMAEYLIGLGLPLSRDELFLKAKEYMMGEYLLNVTAKNNVVPTLKALKSHGVRLNILTAGPHVTLDACLKRLEICDLFENIWSSDDFGTTKADPDIYRKAAAALGVKVSEVLFFDDNIKACQTAKTAGMAVCGVYDETSQEYKEQMKAVTDFYIYDFSEVLSLKFCPGN